MPPSNRMLSVSGADSESKRIPVDAEKAGVEAVQIGDWGKAMQAGTCLSRASPVVEELEADSKTTSDVMDGFDRLQSLLNVRTHLFVHASRFESGE